MRAEISKIKNIREKLMKQDGSLRRSIKLIKKKIQFFFPNWIGKKR